MIDQYEQCLINLQALAQDYDERGGGRNEATTRLHFIDRLLFDCLGWSRNECISEAAHNGEYADYTCLAPRPMLIVEAKREGNYFELPAGSTKLEYSIPSLIRDNPNLGNAMRQAAGYCQTRGVLLAAVANGHQLVAFVAIRQDGPPLEGRAFVFPSLHFMATHFLDLWNAVSKPAVQDKRLESRVLGTAPTIILPKLSASVFGYPGTKARNQFQTSLKSVSELVLEDVASARELETSFLRACYCESGALSEFSLISRDILQARYSALFDEAQPGPTVSPGVTRKGVDPDLIAKSLSRRPILILGDVGVGKTTFLRQLMHIEAAEQFKNAIALHLNLGTQAALTIDLRHFVVDEIARQLRDEYNIDIEEQGLVRGIYHGDLQRFDRGIYAPLRDVNPQAFIEKEIAYLESKLSDKVGHLKHTLVHLEKARKKQIIIFLDNADQRDYDTQQKAFLIAQEIAANWPATVFITLRPETFHLSLRSGGTLSGYHPKAFTISPPRIDRVIEKRLRFGLEITRGNIPISRLSHVHVQLHSLDAIISALLNTISERKDIGELIDNIAGGNVRLALDLVQSFFGSGHINTEKIVDIYSQTGRYTVAVHEFLRAVIYGDQVHYDSTRSYVANIFDISVPDPKEHFILPIALNHLDSWNGPGSQNGFIETTLFYDRIQGLGYTPNQIDAALVRAHKHNLIEMAARRAPEPGKELPPSIRITSIGAYHLHRLMSMFTYVDAMVIDTPILEPSTRKRITSTLVIEERLERAQLFCTYLDTQWKSVPPTASPFNWTQCSNAVRADIERIMDKHLSA